MDQQVSGFDYIIVGGGTAGAILANRLTADGRHRVLVLEAGENASSMWISIPAGFSKLLTDPRFNWRFATEPEDNTRGRVISVPRGKGLGGSTLINGMIYVRGQPGDYDAWARAGDVHELRLHGDCHPGNILWREDQAHFVDLDDCLSGPAVQDLWMLAGRREDSAAPLRWLLEGYEQFRRFDRRELHLIEPLRTLRLLHYNAWIARRWHDPAFPVAFPWFEAPRHWESVITQMQEQLAALQEPPPDPD